MGGLAGRVSLDLLCALPSSLARTRRLAHSERRSRASGRSSHLESAGRRSPLPLFLSASRPRVEPASCSIRHVPLLHSSRFRRLRMASSSEGRLLRGPPPQRAASSEDRLLRGPPRPRPRRRRRRRRPLHRRRPPPRSRPRGRASRGRWWRTPRPPRAGRGRCRPARARTSRSCP